MSQSSDDQDTKIVGILITTIVALLMAFVVGLGISKSRTAAPAEAPEALVAQVEPLSDSRIEIADGMVKFFFASGSAQLADGVEPAIAQAVAAAGQGRTLVLSGFHDSTGSPEANARLAMQRAANVRDALTAAGVPEQQVELRKPEVMLGEGSMAEARRVELVIAD